MHPILAIIQEEPGWSWIIWMALCLLVFSAALTLLTYVTSLPLRRQNRARSFLDFLDLALRRGMSVREAICSGSQTRDTSLGVPFHHLACYLEQGFSLSESLEKVPGYLPPGLRTLIAIGERTGNLPRLVVACKQRLRDGIPAFLKAQNYFAMLPFGLAALSLLVVVPVLFVSVAPKFTEIFKDMSGDPALYSTLLIQTVCKYQYVLIGASQAAVLCTLGCFILSLSYLGGPALTTWLWSGLPQWRDRLVWRLPWHRLRCYRDFTGSLALLLDAAVPEQEAITLAAASSDNRVLMQKARDAVQQLSEGHKLPETLKGMLSAPQYQWRLANAFTCERGYGQALRGVEESLDARAFQLEQTFVQVVTTGLVLTNGAVVAFVCIAFFQVITALTMEAVLW